MKFSGKKRDWKTLILLCKVVVCITIDIYVVFPLNLFYFDLLYFALFCSLLLYIWFALLYFALLFWLSLLVACGLCFYHLSTVCHFNFDTPLNRCIKYRRQRISMIEKQTVPVTCIQLVLKKSTLHCHKRASQTDQTKAQQVNMHQECCFCLIVLFSCFYFLFTLFVLLCFT